MTAAIVHSVARGIIMTPEALEDAANMPQAAENSRRDVRGLLWDLLTDRARGPLTDEEITREVIAALSETTGRSVAEVIQRTALSHYAVTATMRELLSYGDIQRDEDNGGWMLT